jgi:hypothetical protein
MGYVRKPRGRPPKGLIAVTAGLKRCGYCGVMKDKLVDFYRNITREDGLQDYCKPCMLLRVKETADPDRVTAYAKNYTATHLKEQRAYQNWYRENNYEHSCALQRVRQRNYLLRKKARQDDATGVLQSDPHGSDNLL